MTPAQVKALVRARDEGYVEVGAGYGRDTFNKHAIAAATYRRLVFDGLLTPHVDGQTWRGEALHVQAGIRAYLTAKGREALAACGSPA